MLDFARFRSTIWRRKFATGVWPAEIHTGRRMEIEAEELAKACARAADEIKADDIRVWDLRGISTLTDFMVVCSGESMPHLRAILRDVDRHVSEWLGVKPVYAEARVDSRWVVLDYVDVMVHIMSGELREHYGIERLWGDARPVAWTPDAGAGPTNGRSAEAAGGRPAGAGR